MKKIVILLLVVMLLSGCTVVRIETNHIDTTLNVVLSKDNTLYNRVGKGYKYYVPRGVSYIDTTELNEKLYADGNYYYLYIDAVGYYYARKIEYEENENSYYSRKIDINGKQGYLEINKDKNSDNYFVEFMYNYAKIEALVPKKQIESTVLNASYILSTVKFNNNVIKIMLDEDYFVNTEEKYELFTTKKETNDNFLKKADEVTEKDN